jgi:hypothetical protein
MQTIVLVIKQIHFVKSKISLRNEIFLDFQGLYSSD